MVDWQSIPIDAYTVISSLIEGIDSASVGSLLHEND